MAEQAAASGPDFSSGISLSECPEQGTLAGRVGDDAVLLSHIDGEWFAVGGTCTHYGGVLANGLIGKREVRCPLHHACFDLKTGAVLRAPALDPLDRWKVEVEGDRLFIREKLPRAEQEKRGAPDVRRVVIVGGGAAGLACALELRKLGYDGEIIMLSADSDPPCDRPNLSKDYLAGTAPEEWIPLRGGDWYREQRVDLRLNSKVQSIDTSGRAVVLESGKRLPFDRLLLATGAEPGRLKDFGGENVFTLRSLGDARAIIERAKVGSRAVIVGSSFIGLEAAAALRKRDVEVTVVAPEQVPFERVLGEELGRFVRKLHEDHGVRFHLGTVPARFEGGSVRLADGESVQADFVLVGVGVTPRTELADGAGLKVDNGVLVDGHLETSSPGIFAAGDVAAYPAKDGRARIEHWTVAERQGQIVAANILGLNQAFNSAPFFWTEQYGVPIRYVGHAADWDEVRVEGEVGTDGSVVRYFRGGRHLASASINCDQANLEDELRLERS